jgi:hypothetical protein
MVESIREGETHHISAHTHSRFNEGETHLMISSRRCLGVNQRVNQRGDLEEIYQKREEPRSQTREVTD